MTGIPIYDLRFGQCKFAVTPFDARLHLFCAEPVEYEGCPYCAEHAARCFDRRTTQERRERALDAAERFQKYVGDRGRAVEPPPRRPSSPPKF